MYKLYARTVQTILRLGAYTLNFREPELLFGEHSVHQLAHSLRAKKFKKVLIITDKGIVDEGLLNPLIQDLENEDIQFILYYKVKPNPPIELVHEVADMYQKHECEAMIAFGGGSVIDCGKASGIKVVKPNKSVSDYKGLLKVRKDTPYFIAIPTTAGTGSEATLASVVTEETKDDYLKYAIMDPKLIPDMAVLDSTLTIQLPQNLTAHTGMDALSHAVEAYIGRSNTRTTKHLSKKAVQLIYENLESAYKDGTNHAARKNMQNASYYAGVAFGRAYIGYVHSLSHAITAYYGTPHGYANAIIMPIVLRSYGKSAEKQLADLADVNELTTASASNTKKANALIQMIEKLNEKMNIPKYISEIKAKDIDDIASQAQSEANPLYPVPKIYSKKDLKQLLYQIKGDSND